MQRATAASNAAKALGREGDPVSQAVGIVADTKDMLGESPIWDTASRTLWWVDVRAPALHGLNPATGGVTRHIMPDLCPAVLPLKGGGLLIALGLVFHRFDPVTGQLAPLIRIEAADSGNRLNDSKCDRQGRLWTGTMRDLAAETAGALYRLAGGAIHPVLAPVAVPNALCFSPAGDRVYFTDTQAGTILTAELDPGTGTPGPFCEFVPDGVVAGRPDGATIDAHGFLWNARYGGGLVARFAPDGSVDRLVKIPATNVTSCTFGGEHLTTLFVTTARQRLTSNELAVQSAAGSLFAFEPGVAGLPETP